MPSYLQDIREFHAGQIEPLTGKPVGASEAEVDRLERDLGFELPQAYREYLLWMGKDYDGIFVGSEWFITDVLSNNEVLPALLEENAIDCQLPDNYLVFFSHQGYICAWFALPKNSENPECWSFGEGADLSEPTREGTFVDFLSRDMKGLAEVLRELEKPG